MHTQTITQNNTKKLDLTQVTVIHKITTKN